MSVTQIAPRGDEFERTPPHDIPAEQCVLGGMMLSKDAIADVQDVIEPPDYYRPAHQIVHEVILDLDGRGEPADAVAVAAELTRRGEIGRMGGAPYLHDLLAAVPTAANAGYYARIVRECARLRRLVEAGTRIVQMGYSGGDAEEITGRARTEIDEATAGPACGTGRPVAQVFWDVVYGIENREPRGLTTGIADLDEVFSLDPGEFDVIAAGTSTGKSVLGLNFAAHVAIRLGQPVYYWTGEMSADLCMTRLISAEARVDLTRMLRGELDEAELARVVAQADAITSAPLIIDDAPAVPPSHIQAQLRQMQRAGTPAALAVVDHMGLIRLPRAENNQLAVAEVSRGFQAMAREFDVPLVALHQFNRNSTARADRLPVLSDLRDTSRIEQDAVRVLLLYREDMHVRESPRAGEIDIVVAKNRNGPLTIVTAAMQGHMSRIVDMAPQYRPPPGADAQGGGWSPSERWAS